MIIQANLKGHKRSDNVSTTYALIHRSSWRYFNEHRLTSTGWLQTATLLRSAASRGRLQHQDIRV